MTNLDKLVSLLSSNHVYIQTHNFPDPDAISSAFGLQKLLKARGVDATICYKGKIDRYNTNKMLELFHIEAYDVDTLPQINETDEIILIDAQKGNGNTSDIIADEVASIDHHPTCTDIQYKFSDIRVNIGACASIIASYFFENKIEIDEDVAEALLFGIKIDTADMTRGVSELDLNMFYQLFQMTERKRINFLASEVLQLEDLKAFASAIESIGIKENIAYANTGKNCPEALIATIADFMLEIVDINVALVYSIKENGIKLSVRGTKSKECNVGRVIIDALKGIGTGGGHLEMAGGFVPFDSTDYDEVELVKVIKERFIQSVHKHTK